MTNKVNLEICDIAVILMVVKTLFYKDNLNKYNKRYNTLT